MKILGYLGAALVAVFLWEINRQSVDVRTVADGAKAEITSEIVKFRADADKLRQSQQDVAKQVELTKKETEKYGRVNHDIAKLQRR